MLFVEPFFLFVFLPVVFFLHLVLRGSTRNLLLLIASLVFYGLGEKFYTVVMLGSIVMNHALGLTLQHYFDHTRLKRWLCVAAVVLNLLPLAMFKYASFLASELELLTGIQIDLPSALMHLPIGISFFTFQGLSYVLDVASGRTKANRSLLDVGLYIAFFPQLIAGPIVRYTQFADQIRGRFVCSRQVTDGARRFVLGAAKKMLIANPMAMVADRVFGLEASEMSTSLAWIGAIAYTLQIYFDFSGYSDMAIGLGRMFGFRIPRNFNYPYLSRSITEFWRRWHISLSGWLRDYLYIPLGGNQKGVARTYANLVVVFLLCGLWHGANWGFVVWGIYHGVFLVLERIGLGKQMKRLGVFSHVYAILVVVLGWVLFRASTGPVPGSPLGYFGNYLLAMIGLGVSGRINVAELVGPLEILVFVLGCIASTPVYLKMQKVIRASERRSSLAGICLNGLALVVGMAIMALVLITVSANSYNPFIYFQF